MCGFRIKKRRAFTHRFLYLTDDFNRLQWHPVKSKSPVAPAPPDPDAPPPAPAELPPVADWPPVDGPPVICPPVEPPPSGRLDDVCTQSAAASTIAQARNSRLLEMDDAKLGSMP